MGRGALTGRALRRHWVFAVLLVLAAALRVVVFLAYHPALAVTFRDEELIMISRPPSTSRSRGGRGGGWPR